MPNNCASSVPKENKMVIENKQQPNPVFGFQLSSKEFFVKILAVHLYPFSQNNSLTCFGVISISSQNVAAHSLRLVSVKRTNLACLSKPNGLATRRLGNLFK